MATALDLKESDAPLLEALKNEVDSKTLVQRRSNKRGTITKTLSKISESPPSTPVEVNFYKQKLNTLLAETCDFDAQIEEYVVTKELWREDEFARQTEISEIYSDRVNMTLLRLDSMLDQPVVNANVQPLFPENSTALPKLK